MAKEKIKISLDNDTVYLTCDLVQASAPLIVDGATTPYQSADARHRRDWACLLAAKFSWPEESWPDDPTDGENEAWQRVGYSVQE